MNRILRRRGGQILGAAALLTGHQLGELAVPVVLGFAVDDALARPHFGRLLLWLAVLAVNFLTLSMCWRFGSRIAATVRFGVAHDLRCEVTERALAIPGRGAAGELLTLAVSDARRAGDAVRMALSAFAGAMVLVAALVAVTVIAPLLAVVVIAGAVVTLLAVAALSRPIEVRSHAEQEANADAAAIAIDLVTGMRVLAGLRIGNAAGARYRAVSQMAVGSAVRSAEAQAIVSGIAALAVGCYLAAVAAVSGELALHGQISVGAVIAVLGLSQLLLGPLQSIAQAVPALRRGRASVRRIDTLLETAGRELPAQVREGAPLDLPVQVPGGAVIELTAGMLHGVACDSARVAESLCDRLGGESDRCGARDAEHTRDREHLQVLIGGVPLTAMRTGEQGDGVLVWPRKGLPLGSTFAEMVGARTDGRAAVVAAVEATCASEILERLPHGWETAVAEGGASLSGGERQRVALARALAESPSVLVLCEPTSAVDAVTELRIAAGLRSLRAGLTTLLITTSPALLSVCDEVSLVRGGTVARSGAHDELLADPAYREVVAR